MPRPLCNRILLVPGNAAKADAALASAWKNAATVIGNNDWMAEHTLSAAMGSSGSVEYLALVTVIADRQPDGVEPAPYSGTVQDVAVGVRVEARSFTIQDSFNDARTHASTHMGGVSHWDERVSSLGGDGGEIVCALDAYSPNQLSPRHRTLLRRTPGK